MQSVSQTITDISYAVDDPNNYRFSQAQLLRYINEALTDIARRAEVLEQISSIRVLAQQRDYILPVDVVRTYRVEWMQTLGTQVWPLEHVGMTEMDGLWGVNQWNKSANPATWSSFFFAPYVMMRIYPVPGISGILQIYYYRLPHYVTLNDYLDVPAGWEDLVRDYAEYLCKRADHDSDWQGAKALYESKLLNMIERTRRVADAPSRISEGFNPYPWYSFGELM